MTPSQAIMALCIERFLLMGHVDHMAIWAHLVPEVINRNYKHTFPNMSVFEICKTPSQAMMALCYLEIFKNRSW